MRLAAHKPTSSTVVIRHYAVTHKLDRENLLMAFCHYQYINPAEAKALTILAAGGRDNPNVFSFGQPPQSQQPRFFPQLSASPPQPSTSATSMRDVPVSPRASKKRKQTDTKTPTASPQPSPASATKQCRNTQRQQRYAIIIIMRQTLTENVSDLFHLAEFVSIFAGRVVTLISCCVPL